MRNALKVLLIGGGVAALMFKDQITAMFSGEPKEPTAPPTGTQPPAAPPAAPPPAGIWDRLAAWAKTVPDYQANGTLNFHQWNWGYSDIRKVAGPAPESVGMGDGSRAITFEEYRAALTAAGLSAARPAAPPMPNYARRAWGY